MPRITTIKEIRERRQKDLEKWTKIFSSISPEEINLMLLRIFSGDIENDLGEESYKEDEYGVENDVSFEEIGGYNICVWINSETGEKLKTTPTASEGCVKDVIDVILLNTAVDKKTGESGAIVPVEDFTNLLGYYSPDEIEEYLLDAFSVKYLYVNRGELVFGMIDSHTYDESEHVFYINRNYFKYVLQPEILELYKPFIEGILSIKNPEARWISRELLLGKKNPISITIDELFEEASIHKKEFIEKECIGISDDKAEVKKALKENIFALHTIGIDYNSKTEELISKGIF